MKALKNRRGALRCIVAGLAALAMAAGAFAADPAHPRADGQDDAAGTRSGKTAVSQKAKKARARAHRNAARAKAHARALRQADAGTAAN